MGIYTPTTDMPIVDRATCIVFDPHARGIWTPHGINLHFLSLQQLLSWIIHYAYKLLLGFVWVLV